ncbi:signal peptidase II [Novosphingobium lentum]|uniref:signal peptidase II n=1 Tax=Novosphingobium lentum TaxID=145287 RepID=UPI000832FC8B|nr:signal peptidase II [Novosphingobium lentum]
MSVLTRNRLGGLVFAAAVFGVDRLVKWALTGPLLLQDKGLIPLLPFFDLRWTENYGVSLGLFTATSAASKYGLVAMTSAIAIGVLIWLLREKARGDITALALVLGGALGNIWDRLSRGYVVDYADLHFGDFRPFLIFNIADAAITVGVLILLARSVLLREKPAKSGEAHSGDASLADAPATENA